MSINTITTSIRRSPQHPLTSDMEESSISSSSDGENVSIESSCHSLSADFPSCDANGIVPLTSTTRPTNDILMAHAKSKLLRAKLKLVQALTRQQTIPPIAALGMPLLVTHLSESGPPDLVRWIPCDKDDNDLRHLQLKKSQVMHLQVNVLKKKLHLKRMTMERNKSLMEQEPPTPRAKPNKEDLVKRQEQVQQERDAAYWKRLLVQQRNLLEMEQQRIREQDEAMAMMEQEMTQLQQSIQEHDANNNKNHDRCAFLDTRIQQVSAQVVEARARCHHRGEG